VSGLVETNTINFYERGRSFPAPYSYGFDSLIRDRRMNWNKGNI